MSSRFKGWAAKVRALAGTHAGQQVWRFARIAGMAAFVGWVDGGHLLSWPGLSAAAVGGLEVAYRQWRQTVSAEGASSTVPEPDPAPVVPAPEVPVAPGAADAAVAEVPSDAGDPFPVDSPSQGL